MRGWGLESAASKLSHRRLDPYMSKKLANLKTREPSDYNRILVAMEKEMADKKPKQTLNLQDALFAAVRRVSTERREYEMTQERASKSFQIVKHYKVTLKHS